MIIYNDKNKNFIMAEYHVPVMVNEVVDNLVVNPDGVYVDLTFGGGGHVMAAGFSLEKEPHIIINDIIEEVCKQLQT